MTPPDKPQPPRRLGRGLEALLATAPAAASAGESPNAAGQPGTAGVRHLPISAVRPNPLQPRKEFRPEELAELEASIKATGLLQPVTVRPAPAGKGYELVAGERRLRAATRLGWTEIPALVREVDDRLLLTLALVENLQRADLNPVEEAEGYRRLMDEFGLTQQQVADAVGKDRSTVANLLRILALPATVRRMLVEGQITLGHARALLPLGNEHRIVELAREIPARGLTVRDVEQRTRMTVPSPAGEASQSGVATTGRGASKSGRPPTRDPEVRRIEDELRRYLQTDVHLVLAGKDRGELRIQFYSSEDLGRLLELMITNSSDETM
ncbi:MAG TPA: ParB/RepB/Spo0J family partition protein [Gemmatimonadaceae bacterium]|nr:ParB/RepB/Spo0J family partition protein [Gemmatimonadaceae bacterium]